VKGFCSAACVPGGPNGCEINPNRLDFIGVTGGTNIDNSDTNCATFCADANDGSGKCAIDVTEAELNKIKAALKEGKDVTKDDVDMLTFPENLADDAIMVPVDMRGVEEEFEDVEQMVEKLGPKGAAEAFVKAWEYFEANKKEGEEQPKPMTAAEWRQVLEEDALEEPEEELFMEGEEEDFGEEPEEELGDEEEAGEPDAKKARTE